MRSKDGRREIVGTVLPCIAAGVCLIYFVREISRGQSPLLRNKDNKSHQIVPAKLTLFSIDIAASCVRRLDEELLLCRNLDSRRRLKRLHSGKHGTRHHRSQSQDMADLRTKNCNHGEAA